MSLEEKIIEWAKTRPNWQRGILKDIASGRVFSPNDLDGLVNKLVDAKPFLGVKFDIADLPKATTGAPQVSLLEISSVEHVNALEADEPLTVDPTGITLVYGNNGSGKSGYARVIRRVSRARDQEEVLTDVFRDTAAAQPKAKLKVRVGGKDIPLDWPGAAASELQRMLFYDEVCGSKYISTDSEFPYRPSALFVLDGLIWACDEILRRLDARLDAEGKKAVPLPVVDPSVASTGIGSFVEGLSGGSKEEDLDALLASLDLSDAAFEAATGEEARLKALDKTKERQGLERMAEKLDGIAEHLEAVQRTIGPVGLKALGESQCKHKELSEAAELLARELQSEPVPGAGGSPWKSLWDAARRFSKQEAFPDKDFPNVDDGSSCVLCHQPLTAEARERLIRFERFVSDDTQAQLAVAAKGLDDKIRAICRLEVCPALVAEHLVDVGGNADDELKSVQVLLDEWEEEREKLLEAIEGDSPLPPSEADDSEATKLLRARASAARKVIEDLDDPAKAQALLDQAVRNKKELDLCRTVKKERAGILVEIARRRVLARLLEVKTEAATTGISRKATELSAEHITEVVRDAFTRETERLGLDRVTIAKTKGVKGTVLHQPKLVGARQSVKLPRVFSEGEKTALGLAAYFTEARLDESKAALILDDPVSSLDHLRRERVAARIAELAQDRQVVIFTHDVAFVSDLKIEAQRLGVAVGERSVARRLGGERRPGKCGLMHPWKAKDVGQRLHSLETDIARIKRECGEWSEDQYEEAAASWAGHMSQTWERVFSQEIVGPIVAEGRMEVRPQMVRVLAKFSDKDESEFQASYGRVSKWANRHDKSVKANYVAPSIDELENELDFVKAWFKRVRKYK